MLRSTIVTTLITQDGSVQCVIGTRNRETIVLSVYGLSHFVDCVSSEVAVNVLSTTQTDLYMH